MRKIPVLAAAGIILFAFPALASGIITNSLYDYIEEPYTTIGSGYYEEILLFGEDAQERAALAEGLEKHAAEHGESLEAEFSQYCDGIREMREYAENDDADSITDSVTASLEYDVLPQRDDAKVFSYVGHYYSYSGGVHGYYSYSGVSFDPQTGELLQLTDVFSDPDLLQTVLEEQLLAKYPDGSFAENGGSLDGYGTGEEDVPYNWVLGPQGAVFFFNPYEIASYAEGLHFTEIRYAEHPELFLKDYTAEGSYAFAIPTWVEIEYDLDGDGLPEKLLYGTELDEYGQVMSAKVTINDQTCSLDGDYSYGSFPVIMHTAQGKNYLYLYENYVDDMRGIRIVDLNGETPFLAGSFSGGPGAPEDAHTEGMARMFLSDPDAFTLLTRFDLLGTYSGWRTYAVGEDGMPVSSEAYYSVPESMPLTVKKDLPAQSLDPGTLEPDGSYVTILPGEQLTIFRTDGVSAVDLTRSSDGTPVRIELDVSAWPHTINQEDEEDFFEMIFYAG